MKTKLSLALLFVASLAVAGSYVLNGAGVSSTATTTPTVVLVPGTNYAYSASIKNLGTEPIFFSTDTTTNGWVAAEKIQIPTNSAYTCVGGFYHNEVKRRSITSIVIATTNGTSAYTVAFQ